MNADALMTTSFSLQHRLNLSRAIILFALFSCAGWLYETMENIFTFGGIYLRAQLMLPWCPIYGIGGLLIVAMMEPLRRRLHHHVPLLLEVAVIVAGIYVITSAVELSGSYVCEWIMGYVPWDYSQAWGNYQGRIAPAYTLRFVILGLIALYALHPAVARFASAKPVIARNFAIALAVAFVGDYALQSVGVWDGVKDSLGVLGIRHW